MANGKKSDEGLGQRATCAMCTGCPVYCSYHFGSWACLISPLMPHARVLSAASKLHVSFPSDPHRSHVILRHSLSCLLQLHRSTSPSTSLSSSSIPCVARADRLAARQMRNRCHEYGVGTYRAIDPTLLSIKAAPVHPESKPVLLRVDRACPKECPNDE